MLGTLGTLRFTTDKVDICTVTHDVIVPTDFAEHSKLVTIDAMEGIVVPDNAHVCSLHGCKIGVVYPRVEPPSRQEVVTPIPEVRPHFLSTTSKKMQKR